MVKSLRINREIRAKEIRLVGEKGEQLGVMPVEQAREAAKSQNLDLVEVAPTAAPPVCRVLDYGKYKFEQAKREREARKSQRVSVLREVRLRPKIGDHDFEAKARSAGKLLNGGDKVKITVLFRGREVTHPEIGWKLLQRMAESVKEMGVVDGQPGMIGKRMNVILTPIASVKPKKAKEEIKEQ